MSPSEESTKVHYRGVTDYSLSTDIPVELSQLVQAKTLLVREFGSRYGVEPHVSLSITPIPIGNLDLAVAEVDAYFSTKDCFQLTLGELVYEPRNRFFYVAVSCPIVRQWHEGLYDLVGKFRDGFLRSKDVERLQLGAYTELEQSNLAQYGFPRVQNLYVPHVSIGDLSIANADVEGAMHRLKSVLRGMQTTYMATRVRAFVHTGTNRHEEMESIWSREYLLKPSAANP